MSEHGGNLRAAAQAFGKRDFLDFSANVNPFGVPQALRARLHAAVDGDLTRYPDPDCARLCAAFGVYHGVSADNVLCGNGASELLRLSAEHVAQAAHAQGHDPRILIPQPAFGEYAENARAAGAQVVSFFAREADGFVLDLDALTHLIESGTLGHVDAIMLGNPNNPTSTRIGANRLKEFAAYCGARGTVMILDEAFIELTVGGEANSLSRFLPELDHLILVRAVTKSLAVPGLRLGYALANPKRIAQLKQNQLTWSVNALAQCVGDVLGELTEYRQQTQDWLARELPWLHEQLNQIHGLHAYEPNTNFMLVRIVDCVGMTGTRLREEMAMRGILIRRNTFEGLHDQYFRVAVRDREDNERLVEALRDALNKGECK